MIKIVREPSDTPNVQNTDDFIGLRHSYGDYNGYVDKKGQMLAYQVNGSTFTVLSGRAVVNGVEVDIDANGASITVDNVSTTQYHKLYLRVNLATMKADLYDHIGLLTEPTSDDLTSNASGRAYLHLYSFTSKNGVISLIIKQVKKIATLKDVISGDTPVEKAFNANKATKADNATNTDFTNSKWTEVEAYPGLSMNSLEVGATYEFMVQRDKAYLTTLLTLNQISDSYSATLYMNMTTSAKEEPQIEFINLSVHISGNDNTRWLKAVYQKWTLGDKSYSTYSECSFRYRRIK